MALKTSLKITLVKHQVKVMSNKDLIHSLMRIEILESEVEYAKSQLQPHDTGHIHTTISWLQQRIEDLKGN